MLQGKFLLLLAVTLVNVYYWRSRGVHQKLVEITAARDAMLPSQSPAVEQTEDGESCEEGPDVVYVDTFEDADGRYPTLPDIYGVDANDFDQYRAKYLVYFIDIYLFFISTVIIIR